MSTATRGRDSTVRLEEIVAVGLADLVGSQPLLGIERVRHGGDAGSVDAAHLVDERKHAVQPRENRVGFLGADGDAGEPSEPQHLVVD